MRLGNMIETLKSADDSSGSSGSSASKAYYKVDRITGIRLSSDKKRFYLVRWAGFDSDDDTWESMDTLVDDGCGDLIAAFHRDIRKMV